jgi:hypothetical protein
MNDLLVDIGDVEVDNSGLISATSFLRSFKPDFKIDQWLGSEEVVIVAEELPKPNIVTKRGRCGGTWLHPILFIELVLKLNPKIKIEVYKRGGAEKLARKLMNMIGSSSSGSRSPGKNKVKRLGVSDRTPAWRNSEVIEGVYKLRAALSEVDRTPYQVDHIVPLHGRNVSGLHVAANLRIIEAQANNIKNNCFCSDTHVHTVRDETLLTVQEYYPH